MRTAVIRVDVDPARVLDPDAARDALRELTAAAEGSGLEVTGALPALQFLARTDDAAATRNLALGLCRKAFGTEPAAGAVTYLSRGTDEDALGVLAGFGMSAAVEREPGGDGWDVVTVRLARAALDRIPESRIQTALEASLNCEVRIVAV